MRGFFVTGTDTNVGKTIASAWLALHTKAWYWKPIQTGIATDPPDADIVVQLIGDKQVIPSTYVYSAPLAPLYAAQREGVEVPVSDLELPNQDPIIVEGAGGVMVPISSSFLMIDLMSRWQLPVVVVARTTLGTINHTVLTIQALQHRQIPIAGVVLNGNYDELNHQAIVQFGKIPILGHIPHMQAITTENLQRITPWEPLNRL